MENPEEFRSEVATVEKGLSKKKWLVAAMLFILGFLLILSVLAPEYEVEVVDHGTPDDHVDHPENGDGHSNNELAFDLSIGTNKNPGLPEDWPESVLVLNDAEVEYGAVVSGENGDSGSFTVTYSTGYQTGQVIDFYQHALTKSGWIIIASAQTGDGYMLGASGGAEGFLVVEVLKDSDGSKVVISAQPEN